MGESLLRHCVSTGSDERRQWPALVAEREKTGQRSTWPVQSLALETHWRRARVVLSTASSASGTTRARSCSPAALPSPRQANNFFSASSSVRAPMPWGSFNKPSRAVVACYYKRRLDINRTKNTSEDPPVSGGVAGMAAIGKQGGVFVFFRRRCVEGSSAAGTARSCSPARRARRGRSISTGSNRPEQR
jgi:hypothetical protein